MTISMTRRFNILCIMFKIIAFFILTLFAQLYMKVDTCGIWGKHLHDRIISLRGKVLWIHETSLAPPLFFEVPRQESERSCICVLGGINLASFYDFDI